MKPFCPTFLFSSLINRACGRIVGVEVSGCDHVVQRSVVAT